MIKDGVTVYDLKTGKSYSGDAEVTSTTITITPEPGPFIRMWFGILGDAIRRAAKKKEFLVSDILRVRRGSFDKYDSACFVRMKNQDVYVFIFDKMNASFASYINELVGATEE